MRVMEFPPQGAVIETRPPTNAVFDSVAYREERGSSEPPEPPPAPGIGPDGPRSTNNLEMRSELRGK